MKLVVLGATGGIGREIVRQAIARGHSVTAFVRNRAALNGFQSRIAILEGNLLNPGDMAAAIAGHDAILSGFGPRVPLAKTDETLMRDFARILTGAMRETGVKRAVIVSVAFLFKHSIIPPAYILGRLFFPATVRDASAMEGVFESSGLDWTIVRPPRLTDKAPTGKYRAREGHLPRFGFTISRADVADFVLKAVDKYGPENHWSLQLKRVQVQWLHDRGNGNKKGLDFDFKPGPLQPEKQKKQKKRLGSLGTAPREIP